MRTTWGVAVLALFLALSSTALAQPGAAPPPPPQPQAQPPVYYPPPPPQPQQPQPIQLTVDEQRLLARGIISPGEHFGGALVSFFLGFGTGQAVQGRWTDIGWVFTVGEAASIAAIVIGVGNELEDCAFDEYCDDDNDGLIAIGVIGIVGFRLWEIVDAFAGPSSHNRKVRDLHMRLGYGGQPYYSLAPYVAPVKHGDGAVAGFTLRF
ncbi:MAG TPA: hypothetical protein VM261_31435 [Kofleriaceae bacterium]|nr:hypothetical protein [Kofleriaceae bacterium]